MERRIGDVMTHSNRATHCPEWGQPLLDTGGLIAYLSVSGDLNHVSGAGTAYEQDK